MDLKAIQAKLAGLNNKGGQKSGEKKEKIDWTQFTWKPKEAGKFQIRFVPSPNDFKEHEINPFQEVFLHYGYGKYAIYALTNWGEKDPIVEFSKKLKQGEFDVENWRLSGKLEPKMRVFAPIIVRGEEEKGVRLWEFGKEIYKQLLDVAADEDYGDFTDVNEGRDFTLTATPDKLPSGMSYLKATIQIKPKQSPLSKDAKEVSKWLENQPNILDLQKTYKKTFEQLKEILAKFITPEAETEVEETEVEDTENKNDGSDLPFTVDEVKPKVKAGYKAPAKAKSKGDKFNDLFTEK